MKKLPSVYQNPIHHSKEQSTFYSKVESEENVLIPKVENSSKLSSVEEVLREIFKNPLYSYTKKVRVSYQGKTYDTRFIRRDYEKILTIDNQLIPIQEITSLQILP